MAYSTNALAKDAVSYLNNIVRGLRVNDLDNYADSKLLRSDFIRDERYIRNALQNATNRAFDVQRAQAVQDALNAEDTNYANTKNAISELRRNLIGSGSSGANVGAANATALQALLGLGQQNTQLTTEGLRNINNIGRERAAAIAQNAADAITMANDATGKMYDAATSAYASDRSYAAQGAAQGLGELAAAAENAASQERINTATNASQERIGTASNTSQERINAATNAAQERMNKDTNATTLKVEQTTKKSDITNRTKK